MPRRFNHLDRVMIQNIITSYHDGEAKAAIAKRLGIDNATVHYHINKYERTYPEQGNVYSLVKVEFKRVCTHPSLRCSLCGYHVDMIHRRELETIAALTSKLEDARSRLRQAGLSVE